MTDEVQQLQAELQIAQLIIGRQQMLLAKLDATIQQLQAERGGTDGGSNDGNVDDHMRQRSLSGEHLGSG